MQTSSYYIRCTFFFCDFEMPVHVVQPMVQTIESLLSGDLGFKGKDFNQSRQFYEKQMELLKSLKSSFYPENDNLLNSSQVRFHVPKKRVIQLIRPMFQLISPSHQVVSIYATFFHLQFFVL